MLWCALRGRFARLGLDLAGTLLRYPLTLGKQRQMRRSLHVLRITAAAPQPESGSEDPRSSQPASDTQEHLLDKAHYQGFYSRNRGCASVVAARQVKSGEGAPAEEDERRTDGPAAERSACLVALLGCEPTCSR